MRLAFLLPSLLLAAPALAQAVADPAALATAAQVQAQVAAMEAEMKPGQGFLWRPLLGKGPTPTAAIEIWRAPGKPAVHPADGEYALVVKGSGTLVSGGTMTDPVVRNPSFTEGGKIVGGTRRALAAGDLFLVPAGAPHWFGIEPGKELVLLGIKVPVPAK